MRVHYAVAASESSAAVRQRLDHPVIDVDGHAIEFFPALGRFLQDEGVALDSPALARLLPGAFGPPQDWHSMSVEDRAKARVARPPWWGSPARNTRDLATAMLPGLLYDRLDEFGLDVSVVYPSVGLAFMHLEDGDARRGTCRALNRSNAEAFAPYSDRLIPVAAVPMVTPDEAIAGLEHAVNELGFKAVLLAGYVQRSAEAAPADAGPWALWLDMYGIDSAYDYDPVWAACRDLGVSVAFHSGSIGWGSRRSISNYMYNHIGHLAEGQHALAKSLFLGGVTRRFPELNFAFLEGGVAWAASLYADLIGHWEKRNRAALDNLDPANIDRAMIGELIGRYGGEWATGGPPAKVRRPAEDPATLDEWAACGIESASDIKDLFVPRYFFGCEADDPMTTTAFNDKVNPFGARLQAMFGSDIAHWDVPDMSDVLREAWDMVEHGLITETDFRDFTFANPVRFFAGGNRSFFKGTVVEAAVDEFLAG
jgi:predicted TIM-barrel fold metal-dependent hydrolase